MTISLDPGVIRRLADMHAVYRLFDHAGRLLYIGKSGRPGGRFDEHAMKSWWPLVSMITLEWHDTAAAAALAEKRAIAAERPRYNIVGTSVARRRVTRTKGAPSEPIPALEPIARDVLADVLAVFGDNKGLHWQTLAERLAKQIPDRWADVSPDAVSAECRALTVPSVGVKQFGRGLKGCRRADVEKVVAQRLATR